MKKKQYETPTTKVVMLQQQTHLLAGSVDCNTTLNVQYEEEDW